MKFKQALLAAAIAQGKENRASCKLALHVLDVIENLLKKEMGFEGIVVTDAVDMGGFNGFYESKRRSQIESFKAGCDMML